ncbi:TPA: O-antigen ligase family protein [Burkholderia vietnamiensis]|nr:O-antigen ligase family protein [Burkholderia vietnamiensis]
MKLRLPTPTEISIALIVFGSSLRNETSDEFTGMTYSSLGSMIRAAAFPLAIIGLFLIFLLFASKIISESQRTRANWSLAAALIFIFQLKLITQTIYETEADYRLMFGLALQLTILIIFSIVLPTLKRSGEWIREICIGLAISCAAFVVSNLYEFAANGAATTWKGRFIGLTSHPNFMGVAAAHSCVILMALLLDKQTDTKTKFALGALSLGALWLVIISGSRTGFISCLSGLFVLFLISLRGKALRYLVIALPLALICVAIYSFMAPAASDINTSRFTSTQDTRSETWSYLIDDFNKSPFLGVGYKTSGTANSYLRALAASGVFGCLPFIFAILISMSKWWRIFFISLRATYDIRFCALPLFITTLIGAVTEGYLLDLFTMPLLFFYAEIFVLTYLYRTRTIKNVRVADRGVRTRVFPSARNVVSPTDQLS